MQRRRPPGLGGAAITGVIGGVEGTFSGIRNGLASGSHSTSAATLTLGVIGAAGLVEWPVLLAVGGTALVVHQLSKRSDGRPALASATPPLGSAGRWRQPTKVGPTQIRATQIRPAQVDIGSAQVDGSAQDGAAQSRRRPSSLYRPYLLTRRPGGADG